MWKINVIVTTTEQQQKILEEVLLHENVELVRK